MDAQGRRAMKELDEVKAQRGHPNDRGHAPVSPAKGAQATADLALLLSGGGDLTRTSFTSHRRVLGPLAVLAKTGLRRLLTPILERQTAYNAANARMIASLKDEFSALWAATHMQPVMTTGQRGGEGVNSGAQQTSALESPWRADNLPTQPDDPRLDQWYHTIDLGKGLTTKGIFDHRPVVHCYGIPSR